MSAGATAALKSSAASVRRDSAGKSLRTATGWCARLCRCQRRCEDKTQQKQNSHRTPRVTPNMVLRTRTDVCKPAATDIALLDDSHRLLAHVSCFDLLKKLLYDRTNLFPRRCTKNLSIDDIATAPLQCRCRSSLQASVTSSGNTQCSSREKLRGKVAGKICISASKTS